MADEQRVHIEVMYARGEEQVSVALSVPSGTTVAEALQRSGLPTRYPEIAGETPLGIFGKVVARDTPVAAGDRVEIYRPLIADPKQARRRRATAKKASPPTCTSS
jgi:putative ubiquitin-RnfH superfamily antitoxin RatB of RatAB toxin-antitoxin module